MTYYRAGRTTIGPRCLSAVFGMGTGVSTWAWSPAFLEWRGASDEGRARAAQLHHSRGSRHIVYGHFDNEGDASSVSFLLPASHEPLATRHYSKTGEGMVRPSDWLLVPVRSMCCHMCTSGLSTRSSPGSLHLAKGNLILGGVSRLYAFSAYPFQTWLPSDATSVTTGTPEVCPSQSSRTREKAPQVSFAHSR